MPSGAPSAHLQTLMLDLDERQLAIPSSRKLTFASTNLGHSHYEFTAWMEARRYTLKPERQRVGGL